MEVSHRGLFRLGVILRDFSPEGSGVEGRDRLPAACVLHARCFASSA